MRQQVLHCGYVYLMEKFNIRCLSLTSKAEISTGVNKLVRLSEQLLVPPRMVPAPEDVLGHLVFAMKHEGVNLELLTQVLPSVAAEVLQKAVDNTPSSAVIRKLAWLWEEFTQRRLRYEKAVGRYTELFDSAEYFTGEKQTISRWRVVYNGLGSLAYCPVVRRTEKLSEERIQATFAALTKQLSAMSPVLLQRAVEWAYLSESRNSFEIEQEAPSGSKTERFMALLKRVEKFQTLNEEVLCRVQNAIVSSACVRATGWRTEQTWLAQAGTAGVRCVTYVPPAPEWLDDLMAGFLCLANSSAGSISPLIAAGVVSFGFVFLHPFMDGNGRLSRFLIHQQLFRGGVLPQNTVLPVSAMMLEHEYEYLQALAAFSAPCRELWDVMQVGEAEYDFRFKGSQASYRYWDATAQCEFLFDMIREAVETYLPGEIRFLERYDRITRHLNERFDVVQKDLDVLVAAGISVGRVSTNQRKKYRYKVPDGFFEALEAALQEELSV